MEKGGPGPRKCRANIANTIKIAMPPKHNEGPQNDGPGFNFGIILVQFWDPRGDFGNKTIEKKTI